MTAALPALVKSKREQMRARQAKALRMYAQGMSDSEVAAAVGARRETVWRWKQDPRFAAACALYRSRQHDEADRVLASTEVIAAEHLRSVIVDKAAGEVPRLRAAEITLSLARESASAEQAAEGVLDATVSSDGSVVWIDGARYVRDEGPPRLPAVTCEVAECDCE